MKPNWKKIGKAIANALGWWLLGSFILIVVLNLYTLPWTGFGDYTTPTGEFVRGKTLWDWMQLLIIPLFLFAGATAINRSEKEIERQRAEERAKIEIQHSEERAKIEIQHSEDRAKLEREIATDRQQEAALQAYIDRMAELLLQGKKQLAENEEALDVARVRTLTVLRGLDARRKGLVVNFLHEAGLISNTKPLVELRQSDLSSADLQIAFLQNAHLLGANLSNANLSNADLVDADLKYADLSNANLNDTWLSEADLSYANLSGANLSGANLQKANLTVTDLSHANLAKAILEGAILRLTDLEGANLRGATMPDGTIHE